MNNKRSGPLRENLWYFIKWTLISGVIGLLVGAVGGAFGLGVAWATGFWQANHWTLWLMPAVGLLIVGLYHVTKEDGNRGTNMVIDSISSHGEVTLATAPLMFVSTILSHFVSASVGREGAALQIGGSLGNLLGKLIRLDEKDRKITIMCGMSACFSALFGTPLAAAIFSMEVINIGIMYYAAMVPCLFASFLGASVSRHMGLAPELFPVAQVPEFNGSGVGLALLMGALCAGGGILLCVSLHRSAALYQKYFPNRFLRILAGSALFILLTLLFDSRYYNGGGMQLIELCFQGARIPFYGFLLKILFTSVAMGAGFRGGEIVPTLCVGAALGSVVSQLGGFSPQLCVSMGMASLFVSVTNCPVSTMFLAFELFGFAPMPYYSIAVAVSFTLSGYYGLYSSQKFAYSKIKNEYINRKSH